MADMLTPERAADRICELSADARAAVLIDAVGSLSGASGAGLETAEGDEAQRGRALADLARELFEQVDRATRDWDPEPAEQVEVQVPGGAVFASRTPRWTMAVVTRRAALASLMLYDLRAVLRELEGGPPIRRSVSADEGTPGPATEERAASGLPLPELGQDGDSRR